MQFDPVSTIVIFSSMALVPLLLMITTCFLKVSIVLVIVRNALGVQQVPPTMAIYGIALAMTAYIMAPVFYEISDIMDGVDVRSAQTSQLVTYIEQGAEPLKAFMKRHVSPNVMTTFIDTTAELWPAEMRDEATHDNFLILIPSFVISEIQTGFKIGFLIYLPFIVIDLLVSNMLLALGMQMVSPMTVSMPLKILLFVVANGWQQLLHSLVLGYL
ncbi:MAG: type III secretion system export apparatus subunit SctR [Acidiferrobacterales bacterium]|nr:type III secretion system export apparatus subunit SctR [Acidiferrobacterales bacterium]